MNGEDGFSKRERISLVEEAYIFDNNDYLQLTNLSKGKAGNILLCYPKGQT
jgi:hypothetical protein